MVLDLILLLEVFSLNPQYPQLSLSAFELPDRISKHK